MKRIEVFLVSLFMLVSGCVHSYPTKIAEVADVGTKIVQSAHQLSLTAQQLEANKVITTDLAARVVIGAHTIELDGGKLAVLLQDFSAAKTSATASPLTAQNIQDVLNDMNNALTVLGKTLPPGVSSQISQLIANIFAEIGQVKAGLALAGA